MPEKIYTEDELEMAEAMIDRLLAVGPPTRPDQIHRLWLWAKTLAEFTEIAMKGVAQQARTTVEGNPQIQGGPHGLQ